MPKDRVDGVGCGCSGCGCGCGGVGGDVEVSMSPAGDAVHCSLLGATVGDGTTIGVAVVGAKDANTTVGTCVGCFDGSLISVEGGSVVELVVVGAGVGTAVGGSCIS